MGNDQSGHEPTTDPQNPVQQQATTTDQGVFTDKEQAEIIKLVDQEIDKKKKPGKQATTTDQGVFTDKQKLEIKKLTDQEIARVTNKLSTRNLTILLSIFIVSIVVLGLYLSIKYTYFAALPFAVIIAGIVAFFGIMIISNQLADKDDINSGEMRRAIAVAIVVVYLGLLPTLAFQGILQYQVLGLNETPTSNVTFNESSNITTNETIQAAPLPVELSQTAISSFTALVTAVILSYFGFRTWKEVEEIKNPKPEDDDEK